MFDLAEKRVAWIPIKWKGIRQADPSALAVECEHQIEVLAEIVGNERLREIFGPEAESDEPAQDENKKDKAAEVARFKALVSDWRAVSMGGSPAPFTDENIAKLLAVPMFALGFDTSYLRAWGGQIELAEKNSDSSSDSGQPDAGEHPRKARKPSARKPKR